jgi:hypothetical protein
MSDISRRQFNRGALSAIGLHLAAQAVPAGGRPVLTGPRLGVTLDRDKLAEYAELYQRLGG